MKLQPFHAMIFFTIVFSALLGARRPLGAQNQVLQNQVQPSQNSALKVSVTPQQLQIYPNDRVTLAVQVTNASTTVQTFQAMSCSWPAEWKSSIPGFSHQGFACAANAPITITLAPHTSYNKTLEMQAFGIRPGKSSFQMGFTPWGAIGTQMTYWSEKISIRVLK